MEMPCPSCGRPLPVHAGYVSWCDRCGWGLEAPRAAKEGRIDRAARIVGGRLGERMARRVEQAGDLRPSLTPARLGAYVIAVLVHLATAAVLSGGVLLLVLGFPNPFFLILGLVLLLMAVLMRPRLGRVPDERVATPEQAPELHALVREVAVALDTAPPDAICVDHAFNASFGVYGLRRRSVLTLGLPMWAVLEPQERVALLGHELGHGRNGDASRTLVVGTAIETLSEIVMLGEPDVFTYVAPGTRHKASQASLRLLLQPVRLLLALQVQLLLRDRQRAEYLADHLGATAGGTSAELASHEKALIDSVLDDEVRRAVTTGVGAGGVIDSWREKLLRVPEREMERRRRVARLETARLAATHPPTAMRIRVLESRPALEPRVVLDDERSAAIDAELAGFQLEMEERMLDDYRARL